MNPLDTVRDAVETGWQPTPLLPTGGELRHPEPSPPGYELIEKPSRITAVDSSGVEICGARQPYGHNFWTVHVSMRVTDRLHQVIATSHDTALAHVEMIARLYVASKAVV